MKREPSPAVPLLPDAVLRHLVRVTSGPDLSGTRYELEGELGRGAMGVVYAVRDTGLGRCAAMKVLHSGAPLTDEARLAASLEHPGIVPVHEAGTLADGRGYYTMRRIEGCNLHQHFDGSTPLSERLRVFQKICETVAFAHNRGVVHRDLKPANVMAGPFGEVAILDWGLARRVADAEPAGLVAGTPRFMAPELAEGQSHLAGPAADIFSLGAMLLFFLSPPAPPALQAVAAKAMSTAPTERYADATELNLEIGRFLDGQAVRAHRETIPEMLGRWAAGNKTLLLLLAAYVAARLFLFFLGRR